MTKIQVYVKNSYGADRFYPANDRAKAITALSGIATFNITMLHIIRALGHEVEIVADPSLTGVRK